MTARAHMHPDTYRLRHVSARTRRMNTLAPFRGARVLTRLYVPGRYTHVLTGVRGIAYTRPEVVCGEP